MADTGTDFLTFLRANYPEDYIRLSSDDVSDKLVTAILHKHQAKFDIWRKVPERIRDEYFGRVPEDILEAARTDNNLTIDEVREIEQDRKEDIVFSAAVPLASSYLACEAANMIKFSKAEQSRIYSLASSVMGKGYNQSEALSLASVSVVRKQIDALLTDGKITKEQEMDMKADLKKKSEKTVKRINIEQRPENALLKCYLDLNNGKTDKDSVLPEMFVLPLRLKKRAEKRSC